MRKFLIVFGTRPEAIKMALSKTFTLLFTNHDSCIVTLSFQGMLNEKIYKHRKNPFCNCRPIFNVIVMEELLKTISRQIIGETRAIEWHSISKE